MIATRNSLPTEPLPARVAEATPHSHQPRPPPTAAPSSAEAVAIDELPEVVPAEPDSAETVAVGVSATGAQEAPQQQPKPKKKRKKKKQGS